jgi:arylsulfatase A-like enzyme
MKSSNILIPAAWCGTVFGLLEGAVLTFSRQFPEVRSPHKVSPDVLWIAPIETVVAFLLAGLVLVIVLRIARASERTTTLTGYGLFTSAGVAAAILSSGWIHWAAAALLGVGAAVVVGRSMPDGGMHLTAILRRRTWALPLLVLLAWAGVGGYAVWRESTTDAKIAAVAPASRTNVLVIVMDTVRADSFQRQGKASLTPNLDRIVARGATFTDAWSTTSWSLPSQASILTGLYPHEHGADWPGIRLNPETLTLAEAFARRGYVTGAFSSNAAWVTPEHLGRGFLRFDAYTVEDVGRRTTVGRAVDTVISRVGYHYAGRGKKAEVLNAQFLDFLDDYAGKPFFAYLCYMDVNRTFHAKRFNPGIGAPRPTAAEVYDAYEQGLTRLDAKIGELFDELQRRGTLDDTLVFITSDHGESFGTTVHRDHDPDGHGTSLYPEQTRIPMFALHPTKIPAGRRVSAPVTLRDIPVTTAHMLGWHDAPFPGTPLPLDEKQSQAPSAGAATGPEATSLLLTLNYYPYSLRSIVWNRLQYIRDEADAQRGKEELFNLADDPAATKDITPDHELIPTLRRLLDASKSTRTATAPVNTTPDR